MESMITGELTLPLILFFVCFFIVTKRYDEELKKRKIQEFLLYKCRDKFQEMKTRVSKGC